MANNIDQPIPYAAQERAPHLAPAYCYIVQNEDGSSMFLTNRDRPITVTDLPAEMGAADPQEFQPAQIRHGAVESKDRYEVSATTITVTTENTTLQRYFLTAAAIKLRAWIIRGQFEGADTTPLVYGETAITVQSGILGKVGFQGQTIAVEITPEPFYAEGRVPRIYYGRECQHFLYGALRQGVGCGVNKELWKYEAEIVALDAAQRTITIEGQRDDSPENFFNRGHFENLTAGGRMAIAWSTFNGADTDLKLVTWNPAMQVGDSIKAYAGCAHTVSACRTFGNEAQFGGFADVPNRSPLSGVA
jgi:hypothetical protein